MHETVDKLVGMFPHSEKPINTQKCRYIYWNLLTTLPDSNWGTNHTEYLREFYQTKRCDDCLSLEQERNVFHYNCIFLY